MPLTNAEIAQFLYAYADQLELTHDNPYKIRAYRRGAGAVNRYRGNISELVNQNFDLTQIEGIGEGLSAQIKAIVITEKLPPLKTKKPKYRSQEELTLVKGLGAARLELLKKLNINTKTELQKAIQSGELKKQKGFGEKFLKQIAANLKDTTIRERKIKIYYAHIQIKSITEFLKTIPEIQQFEVASSYRRQAEIVGNVSIIVATEQAQIVLDKFLNFHEVQEIRETTATTATVVMRSDMIIHLITTTKENFAPTLFLQTGAETHLAEIEKLLLQKKLILNASGLYKNKKKVATPSEHEIFQAINLSYIPPELRENRGEITAAQKNKLPKLIERKDLKGDLHSHTHETDGTETIEVMVAAARAQGLQYLAITDHSKRLAMVRGLNEERLLKQIKLIDKLNEKLEGFTILKSIEVDILEDGSLDLPDWILKELDIRTCSVHSKFKLPLEQQTERIIRAMDNPYFNILGHATGRLMNSRKPYEVDMDRIIQAAKDRHCFLELNCQPARLDIHDIYCKRAKEAGVKVAISSDSHTTRGFTFLNLGISQARRGWLEPKDVINTLSWPELKKLIRK